MLSEFEEILCPLSHFFICGKRKKLQEVSSRKYGGLGCNLFCNSINLAVVIADK